MSPVIEYLWKACLAILFIHTIIVSGNDQTKDGEALEKRRNNRYTHMFVGKRDPIDLESRAPKYGYYFVGKRIPAAFQTRLSSKVGGRWFVGKRPYAHRMFVGKRDMRFEDANPADSDDWDTSNFDLPVDDVKNAPVFNPFLYSAFEKAKADNRP